MSDFHKELLTELVKDWTLMQLNEYIIQLEHRRNEMDEWIHHAKILRRKKSRKTPVDTGGRGGN
jgi:hypothetical protein